MTDDRRLKRKEIRSLQSESVWLQKAAFALRKAEASHQQVADITETDVDSYILTVGDRKVSIEDFEEALDQRVEILLQQVREMRRDLG